MTAVRERTVAFYTLGCKVNQGESAAMAGMFTARGYRLVPFDGSADVYVINTCTVTHLSDRKSRQMIRKAHRLCPEAVVAVVGCYAQSSPETVQALEGVQVIVGTDHRNQLVDLVEACSPGQECPAVRCTVGDIHQTTRFEEFVATAEVSRTRASLKIQDGCNLFCTYCIIPHVRGPLRSRSRESVLEEARRLLAEGFQEIVLTGIHLGAYGIDQGIDLAAVITALCRLPGLSRLRIGSVEPQEFTPSLIEALAAPQVCPHFHIPLQSGADKVLARMGRRYRQADFAVAVDAVRRQKPGAAITSDLITGFPGETAADDEETGWFAREIAFADLHVFPFSPRQGTPAANFPDPVPAPIKEERAARLGALARELAHNYARSFLGQIKSVLVEEFVDGEWVGHTDNYLRVRIAAPEELGQDGRDLDRANYGHGRLLPVCLQELLLDGRIRGVLPFTSGDGSDRSR